MSLSFLYWLGLGVGVVENQHVYSTNILNLSTTWELKAGLRIIEIKNVAAVLYRHCSIECQNRERSRGEINLRGEIILRGELNLRGENKCVEKKQ